MSRKEESRGFVMTGALMLLLIGVMVAGSFVFVSRRSHPASVQWERYDQTLLAAQTALEKVKMNLHQEFSREHRRSQSWNDLIWIENNASGFSTNSIQLGAFLGSEVSLPYSDAVISVTVEAGTVTSPSLTQRAILVTNTVSAVFNGVTRAFEEVIRYDLSRSSVFDYAYFINNFGWFYGVNCVVNGDIRSNRDSELRSNNLVLNGYSFAVGITDVNRPFQTWDWTAYRTNPSSSFFRPSRWVDPTRNNSAELYPHGFAVTRNSSGAGTVNGMDPLEVPNITILSEYEEYAAEQNGTISQGGVTVVSNVFSGTGPSGVPGAADQGCLVLTGTSADPIVLNGPVVVRGDVIIRGFYTGQGTIYAGRNVHIIGDLTSVDAPQWTHPDTINNFDATTAPRNLGRDFLGLCARGSIVIGNYRSTSFNGLLEHLRPPFVQPHEVFATDTDLGYVSYTVNGTNYFNGDYTAFFGEKCGATATNGVSRRLYESSLSDALFSSLISNDWVSRIDAVIYNNHLTTGLIEDGLINGAIVCRDEALMLRRRAYINWDARLGMDLFRPYLPPQLAPSDTIQWRELPL